MRQWMNRFLPRRFRNALRPLYLYAVFLVEGWRLRFKARSDFFPVCSRYALSTPAYLKKDKRQTDGAMSESIPIADEAYREPPPPKTIGENPLAQLNLALPLPLFVAQLKDVRVYGDAGDVITADNVLLPDISFRTPIRMWHERWEHPVLERVPLPLPRRIEGRYVLLSSRYAGKNYFHWMFNVLPRLMLLERAGIQRSQPDGYITNRLELAVAPETLARLEIAPECVVELDENEAFECDALWVTSSLFSSGHRRREVQMWLREHFLPHDVQTRKRRLFVSRADAILRRTTNEDEVIQVLKPLGFEKIVMGDRSVTEQARLFAEAEIVIAAHSGALANLIFCEPGTRVLDLMPKNRLRAYYWELSASAGLDYYYGFTEPDSEPLPDRRNREDIVIPLEPLRASLHQIGLF